MVADITPHHFGALERKARERMSALTGACVAFAAVTVVALPLIAAWNELRFQLRGFDGHPCVNSDSTLPYYVPGFGTDNAFYAYPCDTPSLRGARLSSDLVIASDLGSNIVRVSQNGKIRWRYSNELRPVWSVFQRGRLIGFPRDSMVRYLSTETGKVVADREVWPGQTLRFVRPAGEKLLLGTFSEETGNVAIWSSAHGIEWQSPFATSVPRAADLRGNLLAVANSGGHEVSVIDITTNRKVFERSAYFPADVRWLNSHTLMVAEEHANRILVIDISSGGATVMHGCHHPLFADPKSTPAEIEKMEHEGSLRVSSNKRIKSVCALSSDDLYSPNAAIVVPSADQLVVTDSDNGRVLVYDGAGSLKSELLGFRDPQSVVIVSAPSAEGKAAKLTSL